MQAVVLIGSTILYAAVATVLNWKLRQNSLWFTGFLAIVLSQTVLFGGDYIYRGYWEEWNSIALIPSTFLAIVVTAGVAIVFRGQRLKESKSAPT